MAYDRLSKDLSRESRYALRLLLARALNKNQILLLSKIDGSAYSLSSFLRRLSKESGVPISTLKMNAGVLRKLDLIRFSSFGIRTRSTVELSEAGAIMLNIIMEK